VQIRRARGVEDYQKIVELEKQSGVTQILRISRQCRS